jgi:serine/threonine protein kinase
MNRIFSSSIIDQPTNTDDKDVGKSMGMGMGMGMGTKLISQGTFGCIFYPAVECDGSVSKNKKYASKLVKNNKTDLNEYLIGKIIKRIKLYEYYYAPVINMCSINLAKIDKRERDMCKIIHNRNNKRQGHGHGQGLGMDTSLTLLDSTTGYAIMKIPFIENISIIDYFTHPDTDKKEILTYILYSYDYLMQNIKTLNEHGIIHFDLKLSNLLIEKSKKIPIIIDFGLSIPLDDIRPETYKKYFYAYSPSYYIWCIEIHIICYLVKVNPVLTKDALTGLVDEYVQNNIGLKIFSDTFVRRFRDTAIGYYTKHVVDTIETRDQIIIKLLKYIKTWDSYSLSLMFLCFIQFISFHGFIHNKLIIEFSKVLLLNFHPNPEKRLSFDETKKKYNAIFNVDETTQSYKKLLHNFNRGLFVSKTQAETMKEDKMTPSLGTRD